MKSWYRTIREDELKDGSIRKVYHLVFETDDKSIVEKIEQFFYDVMDAKTEPNSSEIPNNCEDLQDWKDRMWAEAIVTEPTGDKLSPLDKEPTTDCRQTERSSK